MIKTMETDDNFRISEPPSPSDVKVPLYETFLSPPVSVSGLTEEGILDQGVEIL